MQPVESVYKLIVVYAGSKKGTSTYYRVKNPGDMEKLLQIKAAHEGEIDAVSVVLLRTRKPRRYNYDFYETKILVDDSGAIPTPAETDLLFKPAVKQQPDSLVRTDQQKADWARNNKFDNRTCTWM